MTWYRIEGNLPQHHKYAPLSDAAFRLAIMAGAWCATMMTDGLLPKKMIAGLTRAPAAKQLSKAVQELVDAKIWDVIESDAESFLVHDYLDWNMSRAQWQAKKAAGSSGGKAKAAAKSKQVLKQKPSKRLAPASDSLEQTSSTCSSVPLADLRSPISDSEKNQRSEIPLSPPGGEKRKGREKTDESICPDELEANPATLAVAEELRTDWRKHFAQMRDWSHGNGKKKRDWQATLRNWMQNNQGKHPLIQSQSQQSSQLAKQPLGGLPGQVQNSEGLWFYPLPGKDKQQK